MKRNHALAKSVSLAIMIASGGLLLILAASEWMSSRFLYASVGLILILLLECFLWGRYIRGPAYQFDRGMRHAKKGRHDAAIADFARVIEFLPEEATAYSWRGGAYYEIGDLWRNQIDLT
jgi:tetratricopeptide (TPR) repeat protein